ncbi:hypothetical protein CF326_g2029 [Tilletia indica]|nr:hypothetical protein CF326_g2029 [Tilletia indica]
MATALSLSFLRRYLCDDSPVGQWLRFGLTSELSRRFAAPPALLLVRSGPSFTALQHVDTRAEGLFGRLLHALASVDLALSDDWITLPPPALVTLPWTLIFPSIHLTDQRLVTYTRTGWVTLGDLLWLGPVPCPSTSSGLQLGLPPSRSVAVNGQPLPYAPRHPGGVPSLPWVDMWASLPAHTAAALGTFARSYPSPFRLPGPYSPETFAQRPTSAAWIPMTQDPAFPAFPWHLLTVGGRPLSSASPASIRRTLAPSAPRAPGWTFPAPAPPTFWTQVWSELEDSPLPVDLRSVCLLVLGRNLWTFRAPDALCPAGCSVPDSPSHGICACPEALMVWHACLPLLRALGVSAPLTFAPFEIVGAWPHLCTLRPRLVLWRNVVLAALHTARVTAGRDARIATARDVLAAAGTGVPVPARLPDFHHCATMDVLSYTTAALVASLTAAWDRLPSDSPSVARFRARWLVGSSLLSEVSGSLVASAVSVSYGQALPLPAPLLPSS